MMKKKIMKKKQQQQQEEPRTVRKYSPSQMLKFMLDGETPGIYRLEKPALPGVYPSRSADTMYKIVRDTPSELSIIALIGVDSAFEEAAILAAWEQLDRIGSLKVEHTAPYELVLTS